MIQYRFDDPTKRCFKCGEEKPLSQFYRHSQMADGHLNKCIECTKRDVNQRAVVAAEKIKRYEAVRSKSQHRREYNIERQRKIRQRYPQKYMARQAVTYAIRSGKMQKQPCHVCGCTKVEAHHHDYSKPLEVEWLCFKHHRERHTVH